MADEDAEKNNPFFEDNDVQAAAGKEQGGNASQVANEPPPVQDTAYDEAPAQTSNNNNNNAAQQYIPDQAAKDAAVAAGGMAVNSAAGAAQNQVNEDLAAQEDQNAAPDAPNWFAKCFAWFPLRYFAFFGGILLFVGPILDMALITIEFITFFIYLYLIVFGIFTIITESPVFRLTRWLQLNMFFWFRFLSRLWGRAWFYLFISVLCYMNPNDGKSITLYVGIYLNVICLASFIYSRLAAKKYCRMFVFMAAGTEGEELELKMAEKFDELDKDEDGRIGSQEIQALALEAGRDLANAERHAIQTFLDESCYGAVTKEDWMKQWTQYNMKQHFL